MKRLIALAAQALVRPHMWAVVYVPPIVLAVAMGMFAAGSKRRWLLTILAVALLQVVVFALAVPPQDLVSTVVITIASPWAAVASLIALSAYPRHAKVVATLVPVGYVVTMAVAVTVGVNIGAVRL